VNILTLTSPLVGLCSRRAEYNSARSSKQLLALAQQAQDSNNAPGGRPRFGTTLHNLAQQQMRTPFYAGLALTIPAAPHLCVALWRDAAYVPELCCSCLCFLGYPDQGCAEPGSRAAAQQIVHPFSLGFALFTLAMVHQDRRECVQFQECAEAASAFHRTGFSVLDSGQFYAAGGRSAPGTGKERIEQPPKA